MLAVTFYELFTYMSSIFHYVSHQHLGDAYVFASLIRFH